MNSAMGELISWFWEVSILTVPVVRVRYRRADVHDSESDQKFMIKSTLNTVIYILDQVRAFEEELLLRIKQQGLTIKPHILVVRSTGVVDQINRQTIQGRKHGGGIQFGGMECDSLFAHRAGYLLHDRLHTCSDYHIVEVCSLCESILTATIMPQQKKVVRQIRGLPPTRTPKTSCVIPIKLTKGSRL